MSCSNYKILSYSNVLLDGRKATCQNISLNLKLGHQYPGEGHTAVAIEWSEGYIEDGNGQLKVLNTGKTKPK